MATVVISIVRLVAKTLFTTSYWTALLTRYCSTLFMLWSAESLIFLSKVYRELFISILRRREYLGAVFSLLYSQIFLLLPLWPRSWRLAIIIDPIVSKRFNRISERFILISLLYAVWVDYMYYNRVHFWMVKSSLEGSLQCLVTLMISNIVHSGNLDFKSSTSIILVPADMSRFKSSLLTSLGEYIYTRSKFPCSLMAIFSSLLLLWSLYTIIYSNAWLHYNSVYVWLLSLRIIFLFWLIIWTRS